MLLSVVLLARPALAATSPELTELDIAPFSVAVHPKLKLGLSKDQENARTEFAYIIPPDANSLDVLDLSWSKGKYKASIAVAQTLSKDDTPGSDVLTSIAVGFEDEDPRRIDIPDAVRSGVLARMAIWPSSSTADAELIVLMSFTSGMDDATMAGFVLSPDGSGRLIDLHGARTLYGWFEVRDVGGPDGAYELLTRRNLDGTLGGFYYQAVRSWDPGLASFVAQPDQYKDFFRQELDFLNWVLSTAALIQASPDKYLNKDDFGPQYVAEYADDIYGFDMLITVPASYTMAGPGDRQGPSAEDINAQARQALKYISDYRDELQGWLGGGAVPATWRIPR